MKAVSFFKHVAVLLFLNVLVKPLWIFGVDRQVQNTVGHEVYGVYFSLLNLSLVFSFLTDAGLSNMVNRQAAAGLPCNGGQLLGVKLFLALLYSVLVLSVAWLSGVHSWNILVPVLGIQVLLSFFNFLRSLITAHQLFQWDVWLSVIDKALMLLLFLPLLYLFQNPISILFFLHAQLVCTFIALSVALLLVLKKNLLHTTARWQNSMGLLKSVAPYAAIILAMSAHNRLDGFLLERLHPNGAYEAGVYAAAYRLLDAANMMGYLVASFLVPFIARNQANNILMQQTVLTARYGLLLFGAFVSLFVVVFAVPLQQLLYPTSTFYTAQVMQWCLPVLPAYLLLQVYGSLLTARAQLPLFLRLLTVAVLINILLNCLLIPKWGAEGCCVAALISQYVCAVSVYFFATRTNHFRHDARQFLHLCIVLLFLSALFYLGRLHVSLLVLAFAGGIVVLLALFAYLPRVKRSLILSR